MRRYAMPNRKEEIRKRKMGSDAKAIIFVISYHCQYDIRLFSFSIHFPSFQQLVTEKKETKGKKKK